MRARPRAEPPATFTASSEVSDHERGVMANGSEQAAFEEQLITQLARDRREGQDTTQIVKELLALAARANRVALDRLAK
jgi:hypothetical protein